MCARAARLFARFIPSRAYVVLPALVFFVACGGGGNGTPVTLATTSIPTAIKPVISRFEASVESVDPGGSSILSWSVIGATTVDIDNGIGAVSGSSVTVNPAVSTTYTLTASNGAGSSTAQVMVSIKSHVLTLFAGALNGGCADGFRTAARFNGIGAMVTDGSGTLYLCDSTSHTIRKIDKQGQVSTLAGQPGQFGFANGQGNAARFNCPTGLTIGKDGNLYVGDVRNGAIRKVTPDGVVSTFVGGTSGTSLGGHSLVVDGLGNLYTTTRDVIQRISPTGDVSVLAGGSNGSLDGKGTTARFNSPMGLATDGTTLYVADTGNTTIRKVILSDGSVTTLAGIAGQKGILDGKNLAAQFADLGGLDLDKAGDLWVVDSTVLRKVTSAGDVSTMAGKKGSIGYQDGQGTMAIFAEPTSVLCNSDGSLLLADATCLRQVSSTLAVSTWAGMGVRGGSVDGKGPDARFAVLNNAALDGQDNLYVTDDFAHTIRKIRPDGTVSSLAGVAGQAGSTDGPANQATFNRPWGVVADTKGNVFVSEYGNHTLRKISADGTVSTLAGLAGQRATTDGKGADARFSNPTGLALDSAGNIYVSEDGGNVVRKVTPDGTVSTYAKSTGFLWPFGVAVAKDGAVYVCQDYKIHKIAKDGTISVLAGADEGGNVDAPGAAARFGHLFGLAIDGFDNLYATDLKNNSVRKITPSGEVSTVIGNGRSETALGDLPGSINAPCGISVDSKGNIYLTVLGAVLKVFP